MVTSLLGLSILELKEAAKGTIVVILLGPPGAGKGTQAGVLSKTLQVPHISTGDLLRANIKENTLLGKEAKGYMDGGKLVPDELILDMLFDRVSASDCDKGYILDGFPRTLPQAEAYHKRLGTDAKTVAINLELSDDTIVERLEKRVTCSSCSAPYHLVTSPPVKEGICNHCDSPLIKRSDDNEEVIRKRLAVYHEQTAPLITYYATKETLKGISCKQSIEEILHEILDHLRESYEKLVPQKI